MNLKEFKRTGKFWEKYDVVKAEYSRLVVMRCKMVLAELMLYLKFYNTSKR